MVVRERLLVRMRGRINAFREEHRIFQGAFYYKEQDYQERVERELREIGDVIKGIEMLNGEIKDKEEGMV